MKQRSFLLIRYLPEHSDNELLAGRCISQLHKFMVNNTSAMNQMAVSFPSWSVDSVGNTIAFVAEDKELLVGLSFQPYFSVMVKEELFEVSPVCEVPPNVVEVRFVRNQIIGKSFIGSKRRRMKRSLARADLSGVESSSPVTNEERVIDSFHRIPISSGSSAQEYILFVQKEFFGERVAVNFNSYGLATNQERRGTVPDLRF